jgi:hypothetical protein
LGGKRGEMTKHCMQIRINEKITKQDNIKQKKINKNIWGKQLGSW